MKNIIELKNINYGYGGSRALKNLNLEIEDGGSVAIIGPNGSGKSTLLKIINGIIFPDSGDYLYNGEIVDSKKLSDKSFSKKFHKSLGFVFQNSDAQLFCQNVFEEIAFGPRQMQLHEDDVNIRVKDCMDMLGIENLKHREPYHLSEGEKKKVAIAAVLAINPDALVLDEPLDGLDPRTKRFMKELIKSLNKGGKTIICATHEFEYIEGIFERTAVLSEDHELIRTGKSGEILSDTAFLEKHNLK
jgi:cobalt/nickel transport system ATP-binding protein